MTKAQEKRPQTLNYLGIERAVGISDTKVEVFFPPAREDSAKITYRITYDNSQIPITLPGVSLRPNYKGLLRHTITGLESNTTYNFHINIVDSNGLEGVSDRLASAKTFRNFTADFAGIGGVYNRTGVDGMTSIRVDWSLAVKRGTISSPAEIDVTDYTVTIVNSNSLSPGDINNENYGIPQRKSILVGKANRSVVINGLTPDTKYYVQVRANHHGYLLYGADLNYLKEENTKYMEITTLSGDLASYEFKTEGILLSLPPGAEGLSSIITKWHSGKGAFDHYRIYYKKSADPGDLVLHDPETYCGGQEGGSSIFCKKVDYTSVETTIPDLDANTSYQVLVALCQSASCPKNERLVTVIRTIETTPSPSLFDGILSIKPAVSVDFLDHLYIEVEPPHLENGIADGLLVEYQGPAAGSPTILNHPFDTNLTDLSVVNFDFMTAKSITVSGVNPLSTDQYCFLVFPFTYDGLGGVIEYRGAEQAMCVTPSVTAPNTLEFVGLSGCSTDVAGNITARWNPPVSGIYSHFDIFYTQGFFEFATAISSYSSVTVGSDKREATLFSLPSGTYRIGVLTYYNFLGTLKRSGFNSNIMSCTIP